MGSSNNQPHKERRRLYSVATFQNSNTSFAGNRTSNFTFHSVAHQWQADPFKIGVTVKYYHLNEFSKTTVFFAIKYTKKAKSQKRPRVINKNLEYFVTVFKPASFAVITKTTMKKV